MQIFKNKNFNDYGTYHVTNEGETNWHQYAKLIATEAIKLNLKIKCEPNQHSPYIHIGISH
jgi:dTDP-4-dehydrorhamnose reductase